MNNLKLPYLVDVPVLLVFFVRYETLNQVFSRIREAKPSKLYLCQDGPRKDRSDDVDNIMKCRQLVENIDWDCEVHKNYSDINLGCDPNVYRALKWIFEYEDRMIMIEDDSIPSLSFFSFCEKLFKKYKLDKRISLISSLNLTEKWNTENDYFFSYSGTLSGCWGLWRRTWEERDESLDFINDESFLKVFRSYYKPFSAAQAAIKEFANSNRQFEIQEKITSFESLIGSARLLNAGLTIIPSQNMLCNIGMTVNATHGTSNIKHLPKRLQKIFFMKTYEISFPIKHPKYIMPDMNYLKVLVEILGMNPTVSFLRKIEMKIRRMIYK